MADNLADRRAPLVTLTSATEASLRPEGAGDVIFMSRVVMSAGDEATTGEASRGGTFGMSLVYGIAVLLSQMAGCEFLGVGNSF